MHESGDADTDRERSGPKPASAPAESHARWAAWVAGLVCALFVLHHTVSALLESVNWDEFALLQRTRDVALTNTFETGGRPGLAMLVLMPFVKACQDALETAIAARVAWLAFGLGYPVALFLLLRELFSRRELESGRRAKSRDALLGVALLVLVPLWLRWSLQVRTDQPALFFVLISGVFMMRSERVPWLALAAGACAGIGCLFSQKGFYAGVVVAAAVVGHAWMGAAFSRWRELKRGVYFALGWGVIYLAFKIAVRTMFLPGPSFNLQGGLSHFEHYRKLLGFGLYPYLAPYLVPHALLVFGLGWATVRALQRRLRSYKEVVLAWSLLMAGVAIARFHASSFAYFWMTIGLFPAAGAAVALGPIFELLSKRAPVHRAPVVIHGGAWVLLVAQSLPTLDSVLDDTAQVQRNSLDFVARNFSRQAAGFHPEGALSCRPNQGQSRAWFSIHIKMQLFGEKNRENVRDFIQQFRDTPVEFIVPSFRLFEFPRPVLNFWDSHYVRYSAGVMVPGFVIQPGARDVEVIVPGPYRFLPSGDGAQVPTVDGRAMEPGRPRKLTRGAHRVQAAAPGLLVKALSEPPSPSPRSFYGERSIRELAPRGRW